MVCHSDSNLGRLVFAALATVLICLLTSQPSAAANICVVCSQPSATYECVIPNDIGIANKPIALRGVRLACLQGLARAKNHGQCSVRKAAQGPCIGDRIPLSDLVEEEALRAEAERAARATADHDAKEPTAGKETPKDASGERGEPRTLVELTERTLDQTGRELDKVGKTLEDAGGAATTFMRRSWTCVTSFFADC